MQKKSIAALALSLTAIGCTSTMQVASVSEAFKKYDQQEYAATLKLINQAESAGELSDEQAARLTYLKALAYEGLGDTSMANTLFVYLSEQHPDSQYAYLSALRLSAE